MAASSAPAQAPARPAAALHSRRTWLAGALAASAAAAAVGAAWWHRQPPVAAVLPEGDVCLIAPPTPWEAASGLPPTAARPVPAQARCPVCGMYPARAPEWAAQVIFEGSGEAHFFDSPLSLFKYLQDAPRYHPGRSAPAIAALYVSDSSAGAGAWLDARSAWYVHGSDARGPMRAGNLPAFATRAAAQAFARRRGGRVLAYGQVDGAVIAALVGSGGHGAH